MAAHTVADLHARLARSRYGFALVTSGEGVLLGRLRGTALAGADRNRPVVEVMELGQSTLRTHESRSGGALPAGS